MPERPRRFFLQWFLFLCGIEGIFSAAYLMLIPADSKNAFLTGYSPSRIVLLAAMLLVALAFFALGSREYRKHILEIKQLNFSEDYRRYNLIILLAVLLLTAGIGLLLVPGERYGAFEAYLTRLKPAVLWGILILAQFIALLALQRRPNKGISAKSLTQGNRRTLWMILTVTLFLIASWAFVLISGMGVTRDQYYWNEAGVPVLVWQVVMALLLAFMVFGLGRLLGVFGPSAAFKDKAAMSFRKILPDLAIMAILWLAASILWIRTPQQPQPFAPQKYPPNYAYYPVLDSFDYYKNSEFALIGQRLGNGLWLDKPAYSILLFLLQLINEGNFERLIDWHVVVMAIYIPLLYLLGKQLHSRKAGLLLSLLAIFYEINCITAAPIAAMPNPKIIMTEVFSRIGLLVLSILLIQALNSQNGSWKYLVAGGAVLGWNTLIRYNAWALLPFVLAFLVWAYWGQVKPILRLAVPAVFLISCLTGISGWMAREQVLHSRPLFFLARFTSTVWNNRYFADADLDPTPLSPTTAANTPTGAAQPTRIPSPQSAVDLPTPAVVSTVEPGTVSQSSGEFTGMHLSLPAALANHFLHNIVSSFTALPLSLQVDGINRTIKSSPIYSFDWAGEIRPSELVLSLVNLILVATGLVFAWKRNKFAGLLPAVVFIGYHAGNGAALTSGNRYVTAVLWCVFLYYSLGLLETINWFSRFLFIQGLRKPGDQSSLPVQDRQDFKFKLLPALIMLAVIALVSWGFSFIDWLIPIPQKYPAMTQSQLAAYVLTEDVFGSRFDPGQIESFLADPAARIMVGRAIFPGYFREGHPDVFIEKKLRFYYINSSDDWLVLHLLNAKGVEPVVLPLDEPPQRFPNESEVTVIGCERSQYIEALMIAVKIVDDGQTRYVIYTSSEDSALACTANAKAGVQYARP